MGIGNWELGIGKEDEYGILKILGWNISRVMSVAFFKFPGSVLIRITDEKNAGERMGDTCGLMCCVLGSSD